MFKKRVSPPQGLTDSLIGVGTQIVGDVYFAGNLRVDGEIKGNVSTSAGQNDTLDPGTLVVGEHGFIEGEISVARSMINGTVIGPATYPEFLQLQSHARVTGDIHYNTIEIHPGAAVHGQMVLHEANTKSVELKLASGP